MQDVIGNYQTYANLAATKTTNIPNGFQNADGSINKDLAFDFAKDAQALAQHQTGLTDGPGFRFVDQSGAGESFELKLAAQGLAVKALDVKGMGGTVLGDLSVNIASDTADFAEVADAARVKLDRMRAQAADFDLPRDATDRKSLSQVGKLLNALQSIEGTGEAGLPPIAQEVSLEVKGDQDIPFGTFKLFLTMNSPSRM